MAPKRTGLTVKCPRCAGKGEIALERISIGDMVSERRHALGLTQLQLSEKVTLSRAQIANIEGGRTEPPLRTLRELAQALDCKLHDLIPGA